MSFRYVEQPLNVYPKFIYLEPVFTCYTISKFDIWLTGEGSHSIATPFWNIIVIVQCIYHILFLACTNVANDKTLRYIFLARVNHGLNIQGYCNSTPTIILSRWGIKMAVYEDDVYWLYNDSILCMIWTCTLGPQILDNG